MRQIDLRRVITVVALTGCACNGGSMGLPRYEAPAADAANGGLGTSPPKREPAGTIGGFSIQIPAMTLQPGEERTPCYVLPLEITGPSHLVGGAVLHTTPGMHHGNITTRPKTGEGARMCDTGSDANGSEALDILQGGAVLFASSTQIASDEWNTFPDGMAFRVKDGFEIVARMHYLNPTPEPLTIAPSYEWFTIDESTLVQELAPFAWVYHGFQIPPRSSLTVTGSCDFPAGMHIVNALPHMHKMGRGFDVGYLGGEHDGELFLKSKGYDPDNGVRVQYEPAIDLSQGDGATFSCTWNNETDASIVEGIGQNEMCILFGFGYPVDKTFSTVATDQSCVYAPAPG